MKLLAAVAVSTLTVLMPIHEHAEVRPEAMVFSYKVLDKSGTPVPNARITLVAVTEEGRSYGADSEWSTEMGTNLDGLGEMGFGTPPKRKPGKLQVVARHPSIGEVRKTIEWSAVLHTHRPVECFSEPTFVLKAEGGPGLEAWRTSAAREAPALVESLMKAKEPLEVRSVADKIAAGETSSVPSLVAALQKYEKPKRGRLVHAFMVTWNRCRGQGPLDQTTRAKALAIYAVHSYVNIVLMKPKTQPHFIQRCEKPMVLQEVAWVIKDLQAKIAAAQRRGDLASVREAKVSLSKVREVERRIKETQEDARN